MNRNHEMHKRLWNWLAESGSAYKEHWPGWFEIEEEEFFEDALAHHCFACNEDEQDAGCCFSCPIQWDGSENHCMPDDDSGVYFQWSTCGDKEERKKLAAQIRDLPWRSDDEHSAQDYIREIPIGRK